MSDTLIQTRESAAVELARNTAQPFEQANAMPRNVYQCDEFLQRELDNIFKYDFTQYLSRRIPGDCCTAQSVSTVI